MSEITGKIKQVKQYQIGELLGKGAIGEVYKALDTETAKTVAIKQIALHNISQEYIQAIETEINLLKKLDHPNIVKYIDIIQTKTHFNIILEYVEGGSLQNLVKQNGMLVEYLVFVFVKQILEGLEYLHSQGIIHRDIKGANLLFTKNGIIKLADFGYSIKLSDKDKTNSMVGTCNWMAPEVIEQKGSISSACDIWSLGATIIQLLTTKPPYYDLIVYAAMFRIVQDEHPPLPENISENLTDFLTKCFIKDPHQRPKSRDLLNHPWITTPNKKLVKKFINENESPNTIPASIINEWKNNYRDNMSSMASSQNEKLEKNDGENYAKDDEENHNNNEEEFEKEASSLKGPKFDNERYQSNSNRSKQVQPLIQSSGKVLENKRDYNLLYLKNIPNNTIYEVPSEHNAQLTHKNSINSINNIETEREKYTPLNKHTNISLKNLNQMKNANNESKWNIPGDNNLLTNINTKSLSFQEEILKNKSKSIHSEGEYDNNFNNYNSNYFEKNEDFSNLIENFKIFREDTIKQYIEDPKVIKLCREMFEDKIRQGKSTNNNESTNLIELKVVIEHLVVITSNSVKSEKLADGHTETDLLLCLIKLIMLLNFKHKNSLIEYFIRNFGIINFLNILNSEFINSKILFLILYIVNKMVSENLSLLEDFISYQLLFYVTRLIHAFNDLEVKTELIYFIYQLLLHAPGQLKLFLSSGGYFLLPILLDHSLISQYDTALVLVLIFILAIFDKLGPLKFEENALIFINNKMLTRLNIILLEMFTDDSNFEIENIGIAFEKLLDLLLKFTEIKKYEIICNDNILKSLINVCYSVPIIYIPKLLKVFDNLLSEPSTINQLENIGFIECLIKLLGGYAFVEADNDIDKSFFQKITKLILTQIKQMIKLNSARCEQLAILEGIPILTQLANTNLFNHILIPIFSEMIFSTKYVRENLKKLNVLELIIKFIKNKTFKDYFPEMIKNLLTWLENDKKYIEEYIINDNIFNELFSNLHEILGGNLIDYLSILLDIFRLSENIEKKFFDKNNNKLLKLTWNLLNTTNFMKCNDIMLIIKTVDFFDAIVEYKLKEQNFLQEINFFSVLENMKNLTEKNNLIIVQEKVKKIYSKML